MMIYGEFKYKEIVQKTIEGTLNSEVQNLDQKKGFFYYIRLSERGWSNAFIFFEGEKVENHLFFFDNEGK